MSSLDFTGSPTVSRFEDPQHTGDVQSVYSLGQHVWAGNSDAARKDAKKNGQVRLETLDEFLVDPSAIT